MVFIVKIHVIKIISDIFHKGVFRDKLQSSRRVALIQTEHSVSNVDTIGQYFKFRPTRIAERLQSV